MFEYFFKREVPLFYAVHDFTIPKKLLNIPRVKKSKAAEKVVVPRKTIYIPDPVPVSNVSPKDLHLMRRDINRRSTT